MRTLSIPRRTTRSLTVLALGACATTPAARPGHHGATRPDSYRAVDAGAWRSLQAQRVEQLLVGRFPGVRVTQVADGYTVQLRGAPSGAAASEPLFVLDGVPLPAGGRVLDGLNPSDVARIEVLTDPGETSRYGARGANGVVRITTKR